MPSRGARTMTVVRALLGLALLIPGWQKVGQPIEFARSVANYRLLPPFFEGLVAVAIPRLEISLGLCLILGLLVRPSAALAGGLAVGFAVFVSSALIRGLDVTCGCFVGASKVSWAHLALDLGLLAAALAIVGFGAAHWSLDSALAKADRPRSPATSLLAVAITLAPFLLWPAAVPPRSDARPSLAFEPASLDLGTVRAGDTVERTVRFQNTGSQRLDISWIQASCRCTVPRTDKRQLAPGEFAEMKVAYHANPGDSSARQSVRVFQRGKSEPAVLEVQARIDASAR